MLTICLYKSYAGIELSCAIDVAGLCAVLAALDRLQRALRSAAADAKSGEQVCLDAIDGVRQGLRLACVTNRAVDGDASVVRTDEYAQSHLTLVAARDEARPPVRSQEARTAASWLKGCAQEAQGAV